MSATILADRSALQAHLPPGAKIVPMEGLPEPLHPVALFIGKHQGLHAKLPSGQRLPIAREYSEITFGIINVSIPGRKGPST